MRNFFILLVSLFCLASYDSQSTEADGQTDINTELESVLQRAVKWYRKAAEQGDASAQYNLGVMYTDRLPIVITPHLWTT